MALTLKILNSGALTSATLTTLYPSDTVVPGKTALVKNIIIVNKHASAVATVNIAVRQQNSTTDIYLIPFNTQILAGGCFIVDNELSLYLATGPDRLRGSASGGDVQYLINGFERDIGSAPSDLATFGVISRLSDLAIAAAAIVKVGSDSAHVTLCAGTGDMPLGIALDAAVGANGSIRVAMLGAGSPGTRQMIASAAIAVGATLETAASGKVKTAAGTVGLHMWVGIALSAASADGDIIDVAPFFNVRVI